MIATHLPELARKVLRQNDAGNFTKPGPLQYPHQWNWDSALIAMGLASFDLPRAQVEIRSLLSSQWRDGMIPHIVYHEMSSDYFPDPGFWQTDSSPNAPGIPTSGITQPPLLTTILQQIHARTPIPALLREAFPSLLRWHRWLHTERDIDGSGLACIIHPWESGTDDSPRWLAAMSEIKPQDIPAFRRGDTAHVPAEERPFWADYERFIFLIDIFRRNHYEAKALLQLSPFLIQDVLFNSILYRADTDLRTIARSLGEPYDEIDIWLEQQRQSFDRTFWDEQSGLYFDFNVRNGMPIRVNTAATFMPLYAGLASPDQAKRLVVRHLENSDEYAPNDEVHYRLTTTSHAESSWDARRYWRGPVWIILNWFVVQGLEQYGYNDLAAIIRTDSLELMRRSGFREYYDPRDGSGCGSTDFSWSAALSLEFHHQKGVAKRNDD